MLTHRSPCPSISSPVSGLSSHFPEVSPFWSPQVPGEVPHCPLCHTVTPFKSQLHEPPKNLGSRMCTVKCKLERLSLPHVHLCVSAGREEGADSRTGGLALGPSGWDPVCVEDNSTCTCDLHSWLSDGFLRASARLQMQGWGQQVMPAVWGGSAHGRACLLERAEQWVSELSLVLDTGADRVPILAPEGPLILHPRLSLYPRHPQSPDLSQAVSWLQSLVLD